MAPIRPRISQIATLRAPRCAGLADQLTTARAMLPATNARVNATNGMRPQPMSAWPPVAPNRKLSASANGLVRMLDVPSLQNGVALPPGLDRGHEQCQRIVRAPG